MGRRPTIPYDVIALTYVRAVEEGRFPSRALRDELGLSRKAAEWRRTWMGVTGWLPAGDPLVDGARRGQYDQAWTAQARLMVAARLRERRAYSDARDAEQAARAQRGVLRRERAQARRDHAARAIREPARDGVRRGPVMDQFL